MANARVLVKRRKSVRNIHKITRTMQLIATARFQAAFKRATATRPYTEKITELVAKLSKHAGEIEHPLLRVNEGAGKSALLVLTSNRGLCGGYNSNVIRAAMRHIDQRREAGETVDVHMDGKKGTSYLKFLGVPMVSSRPGMEEHLRFEEVDKIARGFIGQYERQEVDAVHVAYMRFISTGRQRPEVMQLLPLAPETGAEKAAVPEPEEEGIQYDFSPEPAVLMGELLPASVKVRLFQCFTDAAVSEQVARMVAMKAATDAASDMIKLLTRQYNRARQTRITLELLDIVGGAEALK
ncbi:MAG: ATP synthase F1 subunit gamma [Phycisphaerae bacterium]|nr:ATP synthase F1 subunit gamma [Phycisphaerae bacterium]